VNDFDENNDPTPKGQHHAHVEESPEIDDEPLQTQKLPARSHSEKAHSEKGEIEESEIGEEEGLNIAEKCFSKIADQMKSKNTTVINHFKDYIASQVAEAEDGKEYEIVFIPPMGFLEGLSLLGLDFTDIEIKCLMVILMKPELENVILVQDLCMVMENFGIEEDIDGITDSQANTDRNGNTPDKETSGAVDMNDLNRNLREEPEKQPSEVQEDIQDEYGDDFENNKPSQSVDDDIKESLDNNRFDYEEHKPVGKAPPVHQPKPDSDEDNEDLFGGPTPEEPMQVDEPNEVQDDIKDEYDFDIPEDVGKEPSESQYSVHHDKSKSDKMSSRRHESDKMSSRKEESDDGNQQDEQNGDDQGAAHEKSESNEYEEPDHEEGSDQAEEDNQSSPKNGSEKLDSPASESQAKNDDDNQDDDKASTKKKKHLKFEILSDKALHILYTMTAYIGENEPEDLFNDFIYEQLIKTRKKQNMIELISSEDFFNVLEEHEVIIRPTKSNKLAILEEAKSNIKSLL
jgi:hypothetical protein